MTEWYKMDLPDLLVRIIYLIGCAVIIALMCIAAKRFDLLSDSTLDMMIFTLSLLVAYRTVHWGDDKNDLQC